MAVLLRQHREPDGERPALGDQGERGVGGEPDDDDVAERADPRLLAQRDPPQQHDDARDDDRRAEREPGVLGDAFVEHIPRSEAERGAHLQRDAHAVEDETGVELQESTGHGQHHGKALALNSIANFDEVASMAADRGLSGPHLARLLGAWRSPARPTPRSLARCGCWCWTAASRCARGCLGSASWPRRSASAARRRPRPTPRCATRASSPAAAAPAHGRSSRRTRASRRFRGRPART